MTIRTRLAVLLIASTVVLAGCGGSDGGNTSDDVSDLSADQILDAAAKRIGDEQFVSIKGKGIDKEDGTELKVDLGFAGPTASGTIAVDGMELQLLKSGGKSYFKASDEFFRSTGGDAAEQIISLISGRWILVDPDDENFGEIASFVSKKDFFDELLEPEGKTTKGKNKTVNVIDCVALKDSDGGGVFYFDKSNARPVSIVTTDSGTGTLDFSYDEIDEVGPPSTAEIVDLSKIAG